MLKRFDGLKVAFHTLGCKLNFAETSTIARQMQDSGFAKVPFGEMADVCVINTCSVTQAADKETKSIVKQALKANPNTFVVVTGCYAQLRPEEIVNIEGVDLVLGAGEKFNIKAYLHDLQKRPEGQVHSCEIEEVSQFVSSYALGDRTRAFLKVQDGCDYKCTYCTIPKARGISRSDSLENILEKAYDIVGKGIKEIVLTGVNTGDYGKGEYGNKKHQHTFLELLEALEKVDGLNRIRISSVEPNLMHPELISFISQSSKFAPHFHMPLQSGNNEVLGWMKRRYKRELYEQRVNTIKSLMPGACIGADVIVGFPGETELHFEETFAFIRDLPISYLHVFTYSERPDTEAINFDQRVPVAERKKRNHRLRILSTKKRMAFYDSQKGSLQEVLWETENKEGFMEGYTRNYLRVRKPFDLSSINTLEWVEIEEVLKEGVLKVKPSSKLEVTAL